MVLAHSCHISAACGVTARAVCLQSYTEKSGHHATKLDVGRMKWFQASVRNCPGRRGCRWCRHIRGLSANIESSCVSPEAKRDTDNGRVGSLGEGERQPTFGRRSEQECSLGGLVPAACDHVDDSLRLAQIGLQRVSSFFTPSAKSDSRRWRSRTR